MLSQLKSKLASKLTSSWNESGALYERDLAHAQKLPWQSVSEGASAVLVLGCGFIFAVLGFFLGLVFGAIAGAFVGLVLGAVLRVGLGLIVALLVAICPTPFAWLARRLGRA